MSNLLRLLPTNTKLYSFTTLSGVVLFLAAGWPYLAVARQSWRLKHTYDDACKREHEATQRKYAAGCAQLTKFLTADFVRSGIIYRVRLGQLIYQTTPEEEAARSDQRAAETQAAHFEYDNNTQRDLLAGAMWLGAFIAGFGLLAWCEQKQNPFEPRSSNSAPSPV